MTTYTNIYEFIKAQEAEYKHPVQIMEGLDWSMYDHVRKSKLYKNSEYFKQKKGDTKPYKNIIRPLLNLQYRTEGFDVKDIQIFVNDPENYYKSLLIKKFHQKWARENKIDTFIDSMVESYVDYGGALVKNINQVRPEVVPLDSIIFADQTDLLSAPFGIKHFYSPDQLKEMEKVGWGSDSNGATMSIDDLILLSDDNKRYDNKIGRPTKTPGKYIEVYEVHGTMPEMFLKDEYSDNPTYVSQIQIIAFYTNPDSNKEGVTLFKKKESKLPFKLLLRDEIYGRALGFGAIEELFDAQIWTNYDIIRMNGLLDAAAKVLYQTTDSAFANRNRTSNLENGEILIVEDNKRIDQINTSPVNMALFERSLADWEDHAKQTASASDAMLGKQAGHVIPFRLQVLMNEEARGIHEWRKGKISTFTDEIYQDWIMPYLVKEIVKDQTFIAELELDELQSVADSLVQCEENDMVKEKILSGNIVDPAETEVFKQKVRDEFMKGGSKRFMQIFKEEMANAPIAVEIDIADKQKDLQAQTDTLSKIFAQIIAAPQVLDDPRMGKIFNQILESSGLAPIDYGSAGNKPMMQAAPQMMQQMQQQQQMIPQKQLTLNQGQPVMR